MITLCQGLCRGVTVCCHTLSEHEQCFHWRLHTIFLHLRPKPKSKWNWKHPFYYSPHKTTGKQWGKHKTPTHMHLHIANPYTNKCRWKQLVALQLPLPPAISRVRTHTQSQIHMGIPHTHFNHSMHAFLYFSALRASRCLCA